MRTRYGLVSGIVVGIALLAPSGAVAATGPEPRLGLASPSVIAGKPVAVKIRTGGAKRCVLSYTGPRGAVGRPTRLKGLTGKEQQLTWVVSRDVRLGRWTVKVTCGKTRMRLRMRVASDRVRRGGPPIKSGTLRVRPLEVLTPRTQLGAIDQSGDGFGKGAGNGGYAYGYCTYYAWTRRPDLSFLGHAGDWKAGAARRGIATGPANAPVARAVAWWRSANPSTRYYDRFEGRYVKYGHVAYVERVEGNRFLVTEMNWPTWNVATRRWVTIGGRGAPDGFIYGGPAGKPPSPPRRGVHAGSLRPRQRRLDQPHVRPRGASRRRRI